MSRTRLLGALLAAVVAACAPGPATPAPSPTALPGSTTSTGLASPQPTESPSSAAQPTIGGRYPDGIPSVVDGELVFRGAAALSHARASTDDTPFLVGGWVSYEPGAVGYGCFLQPNDGSWLHACLGPGFSDVAGAFEPAMAKAITFRFALDGLATEPVVASVRVHDPRASQCGTDTAACDAMMVVQRLLWTGDEATAPHPLSADAVAAIVRSVLPGAEPAVGPANVCDQLPAAIMLDVPEAPRVRQVTPFVPCFEIEPSVAAREQALHVSSGLSGSLAGSALVTTAYTSTPAGSWSVQDRWLAVGNVALLIRTNNPIDAADRAFIAGLAARLESAASAASQP